MAAILGFRPKYRTDGGTVNVIAHIISGSMTLEEGDAVKLVGGAGVEPADAVGDKIYGYVVGFQCKNGLPIAKAVSGTDYDGTYTASPDGDTYVSASDNLTDKKVRALVVPAEGLVVSAKPDATPGTTTGSNLSGYYIDILTTDSTKVDESEATTSIANYVTMPTPGNESSCLDPEDKTRILVMAAETQSVGAATAATT